MHVLSQCLPKSTKQMISNYGNFFTERAVERNTKEALKVLQRGSAQHTVARLLFMPGTYKRP